MTLGGSCALGPSRLHGAGYGTTQLAGGGPRSRAGMAKAIIFASVVRRVNCR